MSGVVGRSASISRGNRGRALRFSGLRGSLKLLESALAVPRLLATVFPFGGPATKEERQDENHGCTKQCHALNSTPLYGWKTLNGRDGQG